MVGVDGLQTLFVCLIHPFPNSSPAALFALLYTFALSLVALGLMLTPMFKSSKVNNLA